MSSEEKRNRYQGAGLEFLEATRAKAEEFLRDLAGAGEATQRQATAAVDDLFSSSRRGTEQVLEMIRREVASQLSTLGLATKADLDALERRLSRRAAGPTPAGASVPRKTASAKNVAAKKAPGPARGTVAKKTPGPARGTVAKKAPGPARGTVAKKAPPAGGAVAGPGSPGQG